MTDSGTIRSIALIVLVTMSAFFVRLPGLENRPMHGDEANQAYKTGILIEDGTYTYDPHDHHGPTLYYLGMIASRISGNHTFAETTETDFRIIPVLFGTGLIALLLILRPAIPPLALVSTAVLIAISPAFVFYSRYYIQEILLVFFTLLAIGLGYRYLRSPSLPRALTLGIAFSLMHATKETAIIAYFAMTVGLVAVFLSNRKSEDLARIKFSLKPAHLAAAVLAALTINILLYSAFFTHPRGPLDSILTYGNYFKRAGGAGLHDKPWYYYLQLLVYTNKGPGYWFSEAFPVLLGFIGITITLVKTRAHTVHPLLLFIAVFTLTLTLIYSLIPYKTPWTVLSLYFGLLVMAGFAIHTIATALKPRPLKVVFALICLGAIYHLSYQTRLTSTTLAADVRNPYVYAHTSSAHLQLIDRIYGIQAIHPDPDSMRIYIIQPDADYWPLPWYLRNVQQVGFFGTIPDPPDADIIIAAPVTRSALAEKLTSDYHKEIGGLRPSILRDVYIRRDLWDAYMENRK